jgi:hypothetical protein
MTSINACSRKNWKKWSYTVRISSLINCPSPATPLTQHLFPIPLFTHSTRRTSRPSLSCPLLVKTITLLIQQSQPHNTHTYTTKFCSTTTQYLSKFTYLLTLALALGLAALGFLCLSSSSFFCT